MPPLVIHRFNRNWSTTRERQKHLVHQPSLAARFTLRFYFLSIVTVLLTECIPASAQNSIYALTNFMSKPGAIRSIDKMGSTAGFSYSNPTVSNVRASQRPGTKMVDIFYDLASPGSSVLAVSIAVSTNGGVSYTLPATSFTGTLCGVAPGTNKKITWDAGRDWPGHLLANLRIRITGQTLTTGTTWAKAYAFLGKGFNEGFEEAVVPTPDGGYIVAGFNTAYGNGCSQAPQVLKLNVDGSIAWQKSFSFDGSFDGAASTVSTTSDGCYIIAGNFCYSDDGLSSWWIVKFNNNGSLAWHKRYPRCSFNSVVHTSDGRYVVAGGYEPDASPDNWGALVMKLNGDGSVVWQKVFGNNCASINCGILTDDGGYIFAGSWPQSSYPWPRCPWILKLHGDGSLDWQKIYVIGKSNYTTFTSVAQTTDGYFAAGTTPGISDACSDAWVLKLNRNGLIVWQKAYGGTNYEDAASIISSADGGCVVAGSMASYAWLFKLRSDGSVAWQRAYGNMNGTKANSVVSTPDEGFIVGGKWGLNSPGFYPYAFWNLKVNGDGLIDFDASSGAIISNTACTITDTSASTSTRTINVADISVTPAPVTASVLDTDGLITQQAYVAYFGDNISQAFSPILTLDTRDNFAVGNLGFTPSSVNPGQILNVIFRVRNLLGTSAYPVKARMWLTADKVLTKWDIELNASQVYIPALASGGVYDYSGSMIIPTYIMPGSYFLAVQLVPIGTGIEIKPVNSVALSFTKVTVLGRGGPSLLVSPLAQTLAEGPNITSFTICNAGGGALSWSATITDTPWLRFANGSSTVSGTGYATITVNYDKNPLITQRTSRILVSAPGATPTSQQIVVTQNGASPPPPTVTRFEFMTITSPQAVNVPFAVIIRAINASVQPAQVQTAFNGDVELRAESGGNVSRRSVTLVTGSWSGNVSLDTAASQTALIATTAAGVHVDGRSNPFLVQSPNSIGVSVTITVVTQQGTPVGSASVSLQRAGQPDIQQISDGNGQAVFYNITAALYPISVEKQGFNTTLGAVLVVGTSVSKNIVLPVSHAKQPVILVPGIMGSCEDIKPIPSRIPAVPILRSYPVDAYPSGKLKIFNPWIDPVGWDKLKALLSEDFSVFEAPWDWRMPVITADGDKVAWREYLLPVIKAAKDTGFSQVHVVAHSMGGLLTRAYIQSPEYAGDIAKFAMVGTPNEGSASAYYLWFGGDPNYNANNSWPFDSFYENTSEENYSEWAHDDRSFKNLSPANKILFYHQHIKALEELLPVYDTSLAIGNQYQGFPGYRSNPLFKLNGMSFDNFAQNKVRAKVFYSSDVPTIQTILLNQNQQPIPPVVWPHGTPSGYAGMNPGDGTVLDQSATLGFRGKEGSFLSPQRSAKGAHSGLIGAFAEDIYCFLTDTVKTSSSMAEMASFRSLESSISPTQLVISIRGRSEPWILDPTQAGAGVSPLIGSYSNGWLHGTVELGAYSALFQQTNARAGSYLGILNTFPGEKVALNAIFFDTNATSSADLSWIGSTNSIGFELVLDPTASNAVTLLTKVSPPMNLASFRSNGICYLTWQPPENTNALIYHIYARRSDESLFSFLGSTTNTWFDTEHLWVSGTSGVKCFYTVVTVGADGAESPYPEMVMNNQPMVARFSADPVGGTPPLVVTFTNQSLGSITNLAWDFDSDGTIDSTEPNPTIVFVEAGIYSVTLTVFGPDGTDTKIAIGYIKVSNPSLNAGRFFPDRTMELRLSSQPGRNYEIQATTDFSTWTMLTNLVTTNASIIFIDTSATNFVWRFYRVVIP